MKIAVALHDMEGFDEVMRKLLEKLPPQAVLSAYAQEQLLLALPVDVLKGLSSTYLGALPEPTRDAVRARIASSSPRPRASQGKTKKKSNGARLARPRTARAAQNPRG